MSYFWSGLLKCEPQQGGEEIHYGPNLNLNEFKNLIKPVIEKNLPHEQTQIIKEEKIRYEYIDKPVEILDNVRLAHELLFGIGIIIFSSNH